MIRTLHQFRPGRFCSVLDGVMVWDGGSVSETKNYMSVNFTEVFGRGLTLEAMMILLTMKYVQVHDLVDNRCVQLAS